MLLHAPPATCGAGASANERSRARVRGPVMESRPVRRGGAGTSIESGAKSRQPSTSPRRRTEALPGIWPFAASHERRERSSSPSVDIAAEEADDGEVVPPQMLCAKEGPARGHNFGGDGPLWRRSPSVVPDDKFRLVAERDHPHEASGSRSRCPRRLGAARRSRLQRERASGCRPLPP